MQQRDGDNNLREILRLRDIVAGLDPSAPPAARLVYGPCAGPPERLAVLAGSFDPLTRAHIALARAAHRSAQLPTVYFLLSKVTVDKERAGGALPEDRLLVLERYAAGHRELGVLLANRGLYVEQAEALHRTFPVLRALYFVVGFDKILQIFDPHYYADRDAALEHLFSQASFLVAPRGGASAADLANLLQRPENRRFADLVTLLPFTRAFARLSSTRVREAAAAGAILGGDLTAKWVPAEVADFIVATGAYQLPGRLANGEGIDRYALRAALISLLDRERPWSEQQVDFPRLLALAWSDTPAGRQLRALLRHPPADDGDRVRRLVSSP